MTLFILLTFSLEYKVLKFVFFKKATKIDEIFTVDFTVCSKCLIYGEDFVKFCGLHKKHELYVHRVERTEGDIE